MQRSLARLGDPVATVATPALVIDLDAMERNLAAMAVFARSHGVRLRPHAKMHKSAAIAKAQIAAGAVGVCVQKLSEAEVLADAGIADIFISNEVIDAAKLTRVAALAGRIKLAIAVDSILGVDRLAERARPPAARRMCSSRSTSAKAAAASRQRKRVRSRTMLSRAACASRACRPTTAGPSIYAARLSARPQCAARRLWCARRR